MKAALHESPTLLRAEIQKAIDEEENDPDSRAEAILLGFGLCSMGICGLRAGKKKIVVPRAHDCITLLLGSRERYQEIFTAHSGSVYWYSPGWIEQFRVAGRGYDEQTKFMEYLEKYGEDNARFLVETEKGWMTKYDLAALIDWPGMHKVSYEKDVQDIAREKDLNYERVEGSDSLLKKLIDGDWDDDFLVVQPGEKIAYAMDGGVICAQPLE